MPATAIMAVLPAFLVLALDAGVRVSVLRLGSSASSSPQPDQPLVFAVSFSGTAHPFHVRAVLRDMDWGQRLSATTTTPLGSLVMISLGPRSSRLHAPRRRVDCIPPSQSAYAPDGFSLSVSDARRRLTAWSPQATPVAPPAPPEQTSRQSSASPSRSSPMLRSTASRTSCGVRSSCSRPRRCLRRTSPSGNDYLASTPEPASVSGPGAPTNLTRAASASTKRGVPGRRDGRRSRHSRATSSTPSSGHHGGVRERVRERGASNVKLIPSVMPFAIKAESDRVKARFCACEMRSHGRSPDTKSPAAQLCSVRWNGCLTLLFKMKSKQLDATKAYCHGTRDPSSPSIFLRLPSMWKAMGYPPTDAKDGRYLIEVIGNLYGTQQAGRIFWQFMRGFLLEIGFVQSDVEPCLFYLFWDVPFTCSRSASTYAAKQKAIVVVFVDDSRLSWNGDTIKSTWTSTFFFLKSQVIYFLPKNAPPLGTRVPESLSHIQTHLILNITIACCITHPAVHLYPPSLMEARAAWHMTTMHIIVRQDCHFQPCHFHV